MSLRTKTILGIALIEALLLVLLISMTLNYLRSTNYDSLEKRARTTVALFSTTTKDAILSYDLASLESFVNEVLKNPDLSYARVLGPNNEVFAEGGNIEALNRVFQQDTKVELVQDGVFDVAADIQEFGVLYGRVEIGIETDSITRVIAEAEKRSFSIAGIEMILVALFSFALGTYLTRQLKVLVSATKDIADGKLDITIPVKGTDELAAVSVAFNAMIEHLKEASERRDLFELKLQELNQSLEDRVEQRTKIINDKNNKLEQVNKQIKETQAKLLQSDKMASVGVLAAGVAHEINNPMSFVISNMKTLDDYFRDIQQLIAAYEQITHSDLTNLQTQLEVIEKLKKDIDLESILNDLPVLITDTIEGTGRVKDIVKGLKEVSYNDDRNAYTLCNINECITNTLKVADNELKYHCKVVTDLRDIPDIYCAQNQIKQVLLNLIINASHAIKDKGKIEIRSQATNNHIKIQIKDNGCGISKEQMSKIFDPFYTTKPVGEGTGLGLSISYGIIKEHNGDITLNSQVGKGTIFTILLPLNTERAKEV
ncbi:sensor histidine kinase [Marinomonas hwangdonensis]|nr:ATP-binding protein [Marinomonas hwangdonensis]